VDITSRAEAERSLQESAARLEESNRYRQLFSDILSHDLMNPVWVAENYLRLIMDGGVPEAKLLFYEGMRGSLSKARSILADARTYLRIQDRFTFSREPVDLGRLVEETAQGLRPLWEEKGQTVTLTLAAEAVCSAGPLLKDVVWHLLSNAVKFGPPDSPIEVAVRAGPRVRLEVRDRGPGVTEADRENIFQRFERLEKGSIMGVGLGLAIARRLVGLYQGLIWVEENPGGGSVFVVDLPAADA
jgi:signal transduction histidine kinase